MVDKIELIKKFVNKVNSYYPGLYINFSYDEGIDEYEIWHNNPQLEFQDSEFKKIVGQIAQDILFDNNVYNFSFGYDHHKTKKIEKRKNEYSIKNTKVNTFEIIYSDIDKTSKHGNNANFNILDESNRIVYSDIDSISKHGNNANFKTLDKSDKIIKLSGHTIKLCSPGLYLANTITNTIYSNIFNIYDNEVA